MNKIQHAFAAATGTYEAHADVQRDVAMRCAQLAAEQFAHGTHVLDAGCGTGYVAASLAALGAELHLAALDIALPMCRLAARYPQAVLCADMARLPLRDGIFDGVISSLALQWVEHPELVLAELARVTKPGGGAVIATFGPDTLHEMAAAFRATDGHARVQEFTPRAVLVQAAAQAGWRIEVREETHRRYYAGLPWLMQTLKSIGASTHGAGRRGLTTPSVFRKAEARYCAEFGTEQGLPATWHVYYLLLRK